MAKHEDHDRRRGGRAARQRLQAEYAFTTREIPEDLLVEEPADSSFWELGEPYELYEPAGGGRMRAGAAEPYGGAFSEEDSGDSWDQFFAPAAEEPYALEDSEDPFDPFDSYGHEDGIGEIEPYGGERYWYGRESHPRLGSPELPEDYEYGQLYGYPQRHFAHRRDLFYATASVEKVRRRLRPRRRRWPGKDLTGNGPKGYVRSDERIQEEIVQLLTDAPWVDAREVEVKVEAGEVSLEGTVEDRQTSRAAEVLAAGVLGVGDVHNRLRRRRNGAGLGAEA